MKKGMTWEIFVYKAQLFAVKWQGSKGKGFWNQFKIGMGGQITMFLMTACFAKTYAQGEQQWKQKSAIVATKKSQVRKPSAQDANSTLRNQSKR